MTMKQKNVKHLKMKNFLLQGNECQRKTYLNLPKSIAVFFGMCSLNDVRGYIV